MLDLLLSPSMSVVDTSMALTHRRFAHGRQEDVQNLAVGPLHHRRQAFGSFQPESVAPHNDNTLCRCYPLSHFSCFIHSLFQPSISAQELFDMAASRFGLHEKKYFGLSWIDPQSAYDS
jgi:hypothetical protein